MLPFIESLIEIILLVVKSIFRRRKHDKSKEQAKQEPADDPKRKEAGNEKTPKPRHRHRRASTTETVTVTKTTEHLVSGDSSGSSGDLSSKTTKVISI